MDQCLDCIQQWSQIKQNIQCVYCQCPLIIFRCFHAEKELQQRYLQKRNAADIDSRTRMDTVIRPVTLEEYLSERTITQMTRPCPKCRCPIEKDGGCYMMTCTHCLACFEWNNDQCKPIVQRPLYFHTPYMHLIPPLSLNPVKIGSIETYIDHITTRAVSLLILDQIPLHHMNTICRQWFLPENQNANTVWTIPEIHQVSHDPRIVYLKYLNPYRLIVVK